ncbi:MAG: flippase-like domain-containing protein [Deltaproteobacteria bacterium]|nr:flippase-like domain-containing protein [Deltaproteobacteria bacterium]
MEERAPPKRFWSTAIKGVAVFVVSIVTFGWAIHGVDLARVGDQVAHTSGAAIAVFLVLQVFAQGARVLRWWLLVRSIGPASTRTILRSGLIGVPAAFLFPLRLGEFVRPAILARDGTPFAGSVAAVVVERVADGLFNVGLFFGLLAVFPASATIPAELKTLGRFAFVGFGGVLVVLVVAAFARGPVVATIRRVVSPVSARGAEFIVKLMQTFLEGLVILGNWRRILAFGFSTALFWGLNGLSTYVLARDHLPNIPLVAGPFTVSVSVFAITVPGGPGAIGTFEAGYRLGLAPFGVSAESAAVISLVTHGIQIGLLLAMVVVGFVFTRSPRT